MDLLSAGPRLSRRWARTDDSTNAMEMRNRASVLIAIGVVEITFDLT
jgi:hypothetical protein